MRASLKLSTTEIRLLKTTVERAWASAAPPESGLDRDLRLLVRNIPMDKAGPLALTAEKWARLAGIVTKGVENLRIDGRPDAVEMAGQLIERIRLEAHANPRKMLKSPSESPRPSRRR